MFDEITVSGEEVVVVYLNVRITPIFFFRSWLILRHSRFLCQYSNQTLTEHKPQQVYWIYSIFFYTGCTLQPTCCTTNYIEKRERKYLYLLQSDVNERDRWVGGRRRIKSGGAKEAVGEGR